MSKPRDGDPDFAAHFQRLCDARNLRPSDFFGDKMPLDKRVSRTTYFNVQSGIRPAKLETQQRFATLLKCTVNEFLYPPFQPDWLRPDVQDYLGDNQLLSIDGAIVLYRPLMLEVGRDEWFPDGEVKLLIEDRPVEINELGDFRAVIQAWERANPGEKPGIKYCVHEANHTVNGAAGELVIKARPIHFFFTKAVSDILISSYHDKSKMDAVEFRQKHFTKLPRRHRVAVPNSFVAHICVVTDDEKLLLFKRRKEGLGYDLDCWSASFEETLNADPKYLNMPVAEGHSSLQHPDFSISQGIRRGLKEELSMGHVERMNTKMNILGFGFCFHNLSTTIFAIAKIPLKAMEVFSRSALKSHDEHDSFGYCPFNMPSLLPVLLDKSVEPEGFVIPGVKATKGEKEWKWHPSSRMRIYLSLSHSCGIDAVEANIRAKSKLTG
jgi:hypothetical protein